MRRRLTTKNITVISACIRKGVRENGGQYTHGAIWFILALIECGRADEAYEIFKAINPVEKCKDETAVKNIWRSPYVLAADVYSGENIGRAGWTWYTGSASWCFKTMLEGFLGVSVKDGNIVIDPAPPKALSTYDVIYDDQKVEIYLSFCAVGQVFGRRKRRGSGRGQRIPD